MNKIFIEKQNEQITDAEISEIEKFYGNRSIGDIMDIYGLTLSELSKGMQDNLAEAEKLKQQEIFQTERQKQIEAEAKEFRKQSAESFKAITKVDFLESNPTADESDFERVFPTIRDNQLLENYRKFVSDKAEKKQKAYQN